MDTPKQEMQNIKLWLLNDEAHYLAMIGYATIRTQPTYKGFILSMGYYEKCTPDGVPYILQTYDYQELDTFVKEHRAGNL